MYGNYNRFSGQIPRVQMTPPPGMNTNCDGSVRIMTLPAQDYEMNFDNRTNVEEAPLGMAYVPWQMWGSVYSLSQGLERGTIFPELDLPFMIGRCKP